MENFGEIQTGGVDLKLDWVGMKLPFGQPTASMQSTYVTSYKAVDAVGNVSTRAVGVETNNSSIPRIRLNAQLGWKVGAISASWIVRYLDSVNELCSAAPIGNVPGCSDGQTYNKLKAVVYNDAQVEWQDAFFLPGLRLALGVNNLFGVNPRSATPARSTVMMPALTTCPARSGMRAQFINSEA